MKLSSFAALLMLTLAGMCFGDVVMLEDFEDATLNYTYNTPAGGDSVGDISSEDYYGRVGLSGSGASAELDSIMVYNNVQGSTFYGVQDMDGAAVAVETVVLDFAVNIADYENLTFDIWAAEDDASDGDEDWDAEEEFLVQYGIDAAPTLSLFAISSVSDIDTTNTPAAVDTDFDGIGDGTFITDTFSNFSRVIAGTGTTLNLRLTFTSSGWAGDEDLAIDNVRIQGDFVGVPEPSSFLFLGLIASVGLIYRRVRGINNQTN